jgi:hypothetical protein
VGRSNGSQELAFRRNRFAHDVSADQIDRLRACPIGSVRFAKSRCVGGSYMHYFI